MKKNILIIIIVLVVALLIGGVSYYMVKNKENNKTNEDNNQSEINNGNENNNGDSTLTSNKILVVYYSAQNHTEDVAKKIANNLNADIFEIVPEEEYTSDDLNWTNSNSRVSREHNDESLRDIKLKNTKVDNWDSYDTVLIGYPIWWGIAAWPTNNFVKENDFTNKTVIPFCTSSSSGIGNSGKLLEELTNTGNWRSGTRFSSNPSDGDIKTFTDSIK